MPTTATDDPELNNGPESADRSAPVSASTARLLALLGGLVAIVAALVTPLLPVHQTTATITWPQGQELGADDPSITAPLIARTPEKLDITLPCRPLAELADKDQVILATVPNGSPKQTTNALVVSSRNGRVTVSFRTSVAASATSDDLTSGRCQELHIFSSAAGPGARFVGLGDATVLDPVKRPQIDGIFTSLSTDQLKAAFGGDLRASITVDNRYETSATLLKILVMILAVAATVVALFGLYCLDRCRGYRGPPQLRIADRLRAFRPRVSDLVVTAILIVWLFLGAGGPDDGYILNMGRVARDAGYLPNYYRYYGIAEAPFDWYYSFLSSWSSISTSLVWLHLPSLIAGLVSWFLLSRVVLPRLGDALVANRWAVGAAAAVFLAFWMPFCSGLRTEGIIVLGSLLTWWAAEKAVTSRQLLPAALAALAGAMTLTLAPQGVIGVAILIVCGRPLVRILGERRRDDGLLPLLAPIVAAGLVVLVLVFRDQTLATVAEAVKIRYSVGPAIPWYQEFMRYYFLVDGVPDGSIARRIPVFLMFAAAIVTAAVLLRRGTIDGVSSGPAWRLVGAFGVSLILLFAEPEKWTIQFGVFAGFGAALAALATLAVAQSAARSTRNLTVFVTALLFALAMATAGYNAWPYLYRFDIPWFDRAPSLAGVQVASVLLFLAMVFAALALWQTLRLDYVENKGMSHHAAGAEDTADRRRRALSHAPIAVIAVLMVVATLGFFTKAAVGRAPAASAASLNAKSLTGSCLLADQVLAEPDPNAGLLTPADGRSQSEALAGTGGVGFSPDGVPGSLVGAKVTSRPGQMHVGAKSWTNFSTDGIAGAGTGGGTGPVTVNGSHAALPYGLKPSTTPVLGSFAFPGNAHLQTDWYRLPDRATSPLLVVSTAGAVESRDAQGAEVIGQKIVAQFGRQGANGFEKIGGDVTPIDPGPLVANGPWRNLRFPMSAAPQGATAMRLVLDDTNLGAAQFLAITPPRAPRLVTLQELVGSSDPTLIDFPVAAFFPCQRPMSIRNGVAELPRWRILPDYTTLNLQAKNWQASSSGGLLSFYESGTKAVTVPTYLRDDWHQDWGSLEKLTPIAADAGPARVATGEATEWGWSRTGTIRLENK
ncbi:MAG: arabinosyltransferase domain-containing protein [Gordonia sp. (in: high G+C Gram-positive bacteria)]|uniref:arabinosyltransferase domain-containing protein n=1 Tax=Gordonia sp. (in: high G+C Gram-positive bacteria) TaxID=84139 RepID=UPI0039E26DD8